MDEITNPLTGERVVFLEETASRLRFELHLAPGAHVATEHIHPRASERLSVRRGSLAARVGGEARAFGAGEDVLIPAGVAHDWWNAGASEALVLVDVEPAGRMGLFLRRVFALARAGATNARGVPTMLELAVLVPDHFDDIRLVRPPALVQRATFAVLRPVARARGKRGGPDLVGSAREP
jgi:mannose-6-phosphate isomerase-like protein (cupin superfamily)